MSYPEIQFVAAPEDGAAVLFDFNEEGDLLASRRVVSDGFSLGTPSLLGDPDGLGVQYGARTMAFSLEIVGHRQDALAVQALLARTFMLRRRGWLRVQLDQFSDPVWLRTYTPTPGELNFDKVYLSHPPDRWQVNVKVAAEPFVRGTRINLWSGTINNNPASGTNPLGVTLPAVVGDAPAPLRISAAFSRTHNQSDILIASGAVPSGHTPIVWQVGGTDGWSAGSDTSASVADAAFSGGSYRRVTFATTTAMNTRLAGTAPTTVPPGRYRVMLRVARDATAGTFAVRLGYRTDYNGDVFDGSRVAVLSRGTSAATVHSTWLDLGDFDFPIQRPAGVDIAEVAAVPKIALQAQRLTGSANLILDCFVLVPLNLASVTTLEPWEKADVMVAGFAGQGPQGIAGELQIWDGDAESSIRVSPAGMVDASVSPVSSGRFPTVRPGVLNRLTMIQQTRPGDGSFGTVGNGDVVTDSVSLTVSYQPRWLWLGAG